MYCPDFLLVLGEVEDGVGRPKMCAQESLVNILDSLATLPSPYGRLWRSRISVYFYNFDPKTFAHIGGLEWF